MLCPYTCNSRQRCAHTEHSPLQPLPCLRDGREDVRCFLLICKCLYLRLVPLSAVSASLGRTKDSEGLFSTLGRCKQRNMFLVLLQCNCISMYPRGAALEPSYRPAGLSQPARLGAHRSALPLIPLSTVIIFSIIVVQSKFTCVHVMIH